MRERTHRRHEVDDEMAEPLSGTSGGVSGEGDDLDSALEEIDCVLEQNAGEFVAAYIQKGGQ